jgi:hypothetical protein
MAVCVENIGPIGGALAVFQPRQGIDAQRVHAQRAAA